MLSAKKTHVEVEKRPYSVELHFKYDYILRQTTRSV